MRATAGVLWHAFLCMIRIECVECGARGDVHCRPSCSLRSNCCEECEAAS